MTSHINRLQPKPVESHVLMKHGSYHLYESHILPFNYPILLWSAGGQKLMLDTFFIEIIFYLSVLELSFIVTSNRLESSIKFILCSLQEFVYLLLSLTFILQKEHPGETRIILNNDKTVFVTANTNVGDRPK
jgi:hypothetical protein